MDDVDDYLARQDRETLVKLILDKAMEDSRWRDYLLRKAASQQVGGADINTFRRSLRNTIAIGDFVDYYAAAGYADAVQSVVDSLEDLLEDGYASDVVELCEEAIALLEDALNSIDDSSGYMTPIMDQVQDLHHHACEVAPPNPHALARRLFEIELSSGYGFFDNAIERYADILGEEGLYTYRKLVDTEWEVLPELTAKDRYQLDSRRTKLDRMKKALVNATGTLEALVAVISKDLSTPFRYLEIAKLYKDRGYTNEAIGWAEQGLKTFSDSYRTGLLGNFLITEYEQQGRFDDAVEIVWQDILQQPTLANYQRLKQQADKAGTWDEWRERAIAHVRECCDESLPSRAFGRRAQGNYSPLVEIFLWEGDVDQAWQAAQEGGCRQALWMKLAAAREADYPADALSIYQPVIEPLINETTNDAYAQAVHLLLKVRDLMTRLDQQSEFHHFLTYFATTYKRKRNFMSLLKREGLVS
jgi:tetratricopeptide (TPR) repeat protein